MTNGDDEEETPGADAEDEEATADSGTETEESPEEQEAEAEAEEATEEAEEEQKAPAASEEADTEEATEEGGSLEATRDSEKSESEGSEADARAENEAETEVKAEAEEGEPADDEELAEESPEPSEETEAEEREAEKATEEAEAEAESPKETESPEETEEGAVDATPESLGDRLDAAEEAIEAAETESELDDVEAELDRIEADLEAADLPEPDEDEAEEDEDAEDPREELEKRLQGVRDTLQEARGPYAEDVIEAIESAEETIESSEWTERGEEEVAAAVESFLDSAGEILGTEFALRAEPGGTERLVAALDEVAEAVDDADLNPDEDEETIGSLMDATADLSSDLEEAEEWDDLTVVQKMRAQGFYDRLVSENRKDFPPERSVVRIAEAENDPERVLMALDYLTSDFMEEKCKQVLKHLGAPEAYDAMIPMAEKRDRDAIEVLGKIGNPDALETLHDYIEGEGNPPLQKTTLRAIGEIGSEESTQKVADRLVAEDDEVRSVAVTALGHIGDTRAITPLGDVLADDEADSVRAAAARALVAIGTERALEEAASYDDDRSYVIQIEAQRAAEALGTEAEPEPTV